MTTLGKNLKLTVPREVRSDLEHVMCSVFGAEVARAEGDVWVLRLGDGSHVGFFFVDAHEALTPEQARRGAWIELCVDDPSSVRERLAAVGVRPFEYADRANDYYQLPGGQVVRVARTPGAG